MGTRTLRNSSAFALLLALPLIALPGCGSSAAQPDTEGVGGTGGSTTGVPTDPGKTVSVVPQASREEAAAALQTRLAELEGLEARGVLSRYPTRFESSPTYDVKQVAGLDAIQASSLMLSPAELAALGQRGFVITDNRGFPTFAYGYSTIYMEDLPVYISADSILDAVHRSYDDVLKLLEQSALLPELETLLAGMHGKLAEGAFSAPANAVHDADLFLAVARSLLAEKLVAPVAGADPATVKQLFDLAEAAKGIHDVELFGVRREMEDFSQYEPRGHYTESKDLVRYFKASMWLGRVDLRLLETQKNGEQRFQRRQLDAMLLLADLVGSDLRPSFDRIDRTVGAFVGEPDYMTLPQVADLLSALGVTSSAEVANLSDDVVAQALVDGDFGAQRISSHIMIAGIRGGTMPLSRSFALLGQRYVLDSHVFSNVVYDRVPGKPWRMMPNPLDAAFAALGNDQAAALLEPELTQYEKSGYPGALAQMRLLVSEHPSDFWGANLYNRWLGALRELSPAATAGAEDADQLFPVARTEAWGRRLLGTQLASWAQLRHDTILYAKQSYTSGAECDFPDGYVDPYPRFYAALAEFGVRGQELVSELDLSRVPSGGDSILGYFQRLTEVMHQLRAISEHQRTGAELTSEMLAFINDAVVVQDVCGGGSLESGWYKQLFFSPFTAMEVDPTIADVHTQPTDEGGTPVGRVLHVGTGTPRLMVVVAEGCSGPRAYAGIASSYREKITEGFERLNDQAWAEAWHEEPEPSWLADLVSGSGRPVTDYE